MEETLFDCHPPHGGCGLKSLEAASRGQNVLSPPTRGVWIEMVMVDTCPRSSLGHPPHTGGCGLKSLADNNSTVAHRSPPTRGVWIEIHQM